MSEHADHAKHAAEHDHPTNQYFIWTAVVLAVFTALETSTYWIDFGSFATPLLLILMTIKFFVILLVFMHLKYDSKLFGVMFYIGLGIALGVYLAALATFQFFA
jgi:cytochrome c oxidase subunit 4